MIYPILFTLLLGAELLYFYMAERCHIVDKPNARSSHTYITLRGGGIVFYFAILFGVMSEWIAKGSVALAPDLLLLTGATAMASVSLYDDIKGASRKGRIAVHTLSVVLLLMAWGGLQLPWWYIAVGAVLSIGFINVFNFMDGINGITGLYALSVLGSLWLFSQPESALTAQTDGVPQELIITAILSVVVFLAFNFRKRARCFAGDVGSVTMSYLLVFLVGGIIIETADYTWLILLSLYGTDGILTIIKRLLLKENIFEPHRKHAYQLLANEMKVPHLWISAAYFVLQISVNIGYYCFFNNRHIYFIGICTILTLLYLTVHFGAKLAANRKNNISLLTQHDRKL